MRYTNTYIQVKDFNKSVDFFEKVLETEVNIYAENRWAQFPGFSIFCPDYDVINNVQKDAKGYSDVKVGNNVIIEFTCDDIDKEYERVKKLNLPNLSELKYLNVKAPYKYFMFEDLDGNCFEVGKLI